MTLDLNYARLLILHNLSTIHRLRQLSVRMQDVEARHPDSPYRGHNETDFTMMWGLVLPLVDAAVKRGIETLPSERCSAATLTGLAIQIEPYGAYLISPSGSCGLEGGYGPTWDALNEARTLSGNSLSFAI